MPCVCWPKAGAGQSLVEECGRRFRNTQERSDVGHQQVTGRNFRVGRQFFSWNFQSCVWACVEVRKQWTAQVPSCLLFLEENPSDVPGSRTRVWQGWAEGPSGAPRAAAHTIRCRLSPVMPRQGWVKITLSVQALQTR